MSQKTLPLLEIADSADNPVFDAFFAAYQRAFILPDEMEDRDGFAECLALNHGARHAELLARYGLFRELCVVARDPTGGALVGGANFIAMPHPPGAGGPAITANLNYVFVDAAARGQGWFRPLIESVRRLIGTLFTDTGDAAPLLIFIEQNDPLLLTPQAYADDSAHSGIDQFDRLRIWSSQQARIVDFAYAQPPLSAGQQADEGLIYSVLGAPAGALSACLLERHLRLFFGISVLKGRLPDSVPVAARQLETLAGLCRSGSDVALLDAGPALARLDRQREAALVREQHRPLRQWLKDQASML